MAGVVFVNDGVARNARRLRPVLDPMLPPRFGGEDLSGFVVPYEAVCLRHDPTDEFRCGAQSCPDVLLRVRELQNEGLREFLKRFGLTVAETTAKVPK